MTVIHFLSVIRRHANVFILVFAFFVLSSVVALLLLPRSYDASAWLVVDSSRDRVGREENSDSTNAKLDQLLRSQVVVVQSEDVIREAIRAYGAKKLFDGSKAGEDEDSAYLSAMSELSVVIEPNTALIRIRYRANEPEVAAAFVNIVAARYLNKYQKLYSNPQATSFFTEQQRDFNQRVTRASAKLQDFMVKNNVYAIEDQRKLLLERLDKLSADLVATQGQIGRHHNEVDVLNKQLANLSKAHNLPVEVSGKDATEIYTNSRGNRASPPLVVIELYMNTVQLLVKENAELSGQQALAVHQEASLAALETQLKHLSEVQAGFSQLQQEVKNSETFADLLFKKYAEAQADNAWRSDENLSTIQVMQIATPPLRPAFPKARMFLGFGLLLGLLAASSAALAVDHLFGGQLRLRWTRWPQGTVKLTHRVFRTRASS